MLSNTSRVEHPVGELDVEVVLEREHHVDARMGAHTRLVEIGVGRERLDVDRQASMVVDDLADFVGHAYITEDGWYFSRSVSIHMVHSHIAVCARPSSRDLACFLSHV